MDARMSTKAARLDSMSATNVLLPVRTQWRMEPLFDREAWLRVKEGVDQVHRNLSHVSLRLRIPAPERITSAT